LEPKSHPLDSAGILGDRANWHGAGCAVANLKPISCAGGLSPVLLIIILVILLLAAGGGGYYMGPGLGYYGGGGLSLILLILIIYLLFGRGRSRL